MKLDAVVTERRNSELELVMRILVLGDVVGKGGRTIICNRLPALRDRLNLDFVVVNGENAAHGRGITEEITRDLFDAGTDVITLGDHAF